MKNSANTRETADQLIVRLVSRLKMRHVLMLRLIHEYGSLTRVAEHMGISQPAATQALAELEAIFGASLFVRSSRGLAPTDLGLLALARANVMLHDLEHWAHDMIAAGEGNAAHLQVGVIPFLPGKMLAEAIARTRPEGRRVMVTIHEDTSDHLLERLRLHELDCVIGRASSVLDMRGGWRTKFCITKSLG